jgi:hypothetical protein
VGLVIADCQLPIFDWRLAIKQLAIGNRKSEIPQPTRYREVVLTSSPGIAYTRVEKIMARS